MFTKAQAFTCIAAFIAVAEAAPALKRQETNLCTPSFDLSGSYGIASSGNPSLFFNATFPGHDFSETFPETLLQKKINHEDYSVSEWYIYGGNGEYTISSRVGEAGPARVAYCLSTNGAGQPCDEAISFAIQCTDCDHLTGCSLREKDSSGDCLAWKDTAGSAVKTGEAQPGPYLCPNTVSFEKVK